jgi:dihydrofolate reductase
VKINVIMACDQRGVIGINGKIPWYIPEDFSRFKNLTMNHAVIMGRKTWESLPVKPLPGRENIVVCSSCNYGIMSGDNFVARASLASALSAAKALGKKEAFVIGGSRLFEEATCIADTVYLTVVNHEVEVQHGDDVVGINEPTLSIWKMVNCVNLIDHTFYVLNRRQPVADTIREKNHD